MPLHLQNIHWNKIQNMHLFYKNEGNKLISLCYLSQCLKVFLIIIWGGRGQEIAKKQFWTSDIYELEN